MIKKLLPSNLFGFYRMIAGSMIYFIVGNALGFIAWILVARVLLTEGRGLLAAVTSMVLIASIFAQVGTAQTNKKFAAENRKAAGSLLLISSFICIAASLIVIPVTYILQSGTELFQDHRAIYLYGLIFITIIAIAANCGEILVGLNESKQYNWLLLVEKFVYLLLILALTAFNHATPFTVLTTFFLTQIARIALCIYFLRGYFVSLDLKQMHYLRSEKGFILINYLSAILLTFSANIPYIFLSHFSTLHSAGLYAAARSFLELLLLFPLLCSFFSVNKLVTERNHQNYTKMKLELVISVVLLTAVGGLVTYLIADWLIPLLLGAAFTESATILKHLVPGAIFISGFYITNSIWMVEKRSKTMVFIAMFYTILICVLPFVISSELDVFSIADSYSIACLLTLVASIALSFGKHRAHAKSE